MAPVDDVRAGSGGDRNRVARRLFAGLPARYDLLAEILSMGQNGRWRAAMVDHVVDGLGGDGDRGTAGGAPRILDVAAGTAGVALQLARRTPASVVGIDLSPEMLGQGMRNVAAAGQGHRVALVRGRAEDLPFPDQTFDGLTFGYLLRYVTDPAATLAELARVLKPGAAMASMDFGVPARAPWRGAWWGYTRLVLPAAGWLTGGTAWGEVGRFLGPDITHFYDEHPVAGLVAAWRSSGFVDVGVRPMSLGGGLVMWGRRAGG